MALQRIGIMVLAVVALACSAAPAGAEDTAPELPKGVTALALFNGKDFAGWHGMGHFDARKLLAMNHQQRAALRAAGGDGLAAHWRVEQAEIVNDGKGPFLTTDRDFSDVQLEVDYKIPPQGDSGVYLRATPQVQIWDFTQESKWKLGADRGSGGLWNNSPGAPGKDPLVRADRPIGQWNRFRIRQVGARTSVWLNGHLVVDDAIMENYWDRQRPLVRRGPIQLQTHGGETRWRNIFGRDVPPDEANRLLRKGQPEDVEVVFNGKDLTGLAGAVDNYEVVDGAIVCKSGRGGNLYTTAEYGDFIVRLEFRLPPGGNNGLAIRYPGSGSAAYDGMCEIQVLDSEHPKYASLDARQYHGSLYGMVAAERGYLRPTGQWNYEQVTVRETTIRVELNGTVIVDADLATVTDYLDDNAHPGKLRQRGHFGFAGHHDPVAFRNITIERLDRS